MIRYSNQRIPWFKLKGRYETSAKNTVQSTEFVGGSFGATLPQHSIASLMNVPSASYLDGGDSLMSGYPPNAMNLPSLPVKIHDNSIPNSYRESAVKKIVSNSNHFNGGTVAQTIQIEDDQRAGSLKSS